MLDGVGRDGEVRGRLVIRNREPLCRMVVMRGVRLRRSRVSEIQGRVRNMSTVMASLLWALLKWGARALLQKRHESFSLAST
jgi:hypothetical protein